jgi:hypothetical protein
VSDERESADAASGEALADSIAVGSAEAEPEPATEPQAQKAPRARARARPKRKPVARRQSEAEATTASVDAPVSPAAERPAEAAETAPAAVDARPEEAEGDHGGNGTLDGERRVSEVVDVGGDVGPDTGEARRRGWWQKLLD